MLTPLLQVSRAQSLMPSALLKVCSHLLLEVMLAGEFAMNLDAASD
jgi:hypothetical protein